MNFQDFIKRTIDQVILVEGDYSDDPHDRGGPTRYGITQAVARQNGYQGDMRELPMDLARSIYMRRYIAGPGFLDVAKLSTAIAAEMIDTGINMGPARPSEMLQRWLNAFNERGSKYADLFIDGRIGSVTCAALQAFLDRRGEEGEKVMLAALNSSQAMRYLEIAEGDDRQERFMYGWMLHRVVHIDRVKA